MNYQANIYQNARRANPTIKNSDPHRANLGFCFSGGGSRALTCAWGQLLGVSTLDLGEAPRYISSVSGGTWASSVYTYLPNSIDDGDLLGQYHPPRNLSLTGAGDTFNVNDLSEHSLGRAPQGTSLEDLLVWSVLFLLISPASNYKWMWASIISEFILQPFDLQFAGTKVWNSSRYFSLSLAYAQRSFPPQAPSTGDFLFVRTGRPFLIMNDNIMENVPISNSSGSNVVLLPNQATPVSAGARGKTPDEAIDGNGSVESYAYNSVLNQSSATVSPVDVGIDQPYSLIDSVSTSSAFFAAAIVGHALDVLRDDQRRATLVQDIQAALKEDKRAAHLGRLAAELPLADVALDRLLRQLAERDWGDFDEFVPTYNYWPIGSKSENRETQYTDGGSLDNTGILGMLSQTDCGGGEEPLSLVVFDNTDTPLVKENGRIVAASQAAPLFGIDFDVATGTYQPFTSEQQDPTSPAFKPTSLIAVFDNGADSTGKTPFEKLVEGLYAANCGAPAGSPPDDGKVNTAPAFFQQQLTTIANPLAKVSAGRTVNMLYIQNAKMLDWQASIGDPNLKKEIAAGQDGSLDPLAEFKDFPDYSTLWKVGLSAKESNALSQMWAWAIADPDSSLSVPFKNFIDTAS